MVASLRFLARNVLSNCRLHAHAPATSVVFRSRASCSIGRLPPQRALQTSAVSTVGEEQTTTSAPKETPRSKPALPGDPSWRHPRLGFPAADLPRLVRINLPPNTTEEDVKLLLAGAGYSNAELTMYYHFETGTNIGPCYVKLAEKKEVPDAIAALSEFTLRGAKLRVQGYDPEFDNIHYQPDLAAGWLPSPSSELELRVHRPPITTKPQLLPPLMAEQWLQLQGLPRLDPDRKGARFEMLRELYNRFHSYDVVGITRIREHRIKRNGWTCRILFGNHQDATNARKSFVGSKFMGNKIYAKTYRAGPDVHSRLWKYRESLPEDTPPEKIGDLLEMKYKELLIEQRKISSRSNYPTSSSAVGLKEDTGTTT